jgi:O-antigen/teichoic acid export membrane protein
MHLKNKAYSAVRWTAAATIVRAVLQIAQVAVLARLLSPEDYGLMAMVGVVLGFAGPFADFGMNSAFVQQQNVTQEERSSLFWLNVVLGAVLSLLMIALSPLFSWFFGDVRLAPLMMLSASTFVIGALGLQVRMAAEKELDFRPVVSLELSAAILGFISALFAAFAGWGVYALVVGGIVNAVTSTAFAWMFIARGWRPMWRLRLVDVRPYLRFGGGVLTVNALSYINMSVDMFLGGRLLGASQLGLYSVPRNLVLQLQMMVNPIITRVGFPLIAKVQHDVARVRSIYLKTLNMTASTNAPLYMGIAFFTPEIVDIMLGNRWHGAAPLLRILAAWGLFRSLGNPVGSLLFGMGRSGLALKWNIGLLFIVPPVVWLGSQYGAEGLAWSLLGLMVGLFIPGWYILVRPLCQAGLIEYSIAALRPFMLALLSVLPAYFVTNQFDGVGVRLILGVVVSVPLYLAISYRFNREWFGAMKELVGHKSS